MKSKLLVQIVLLVLLAAVLAGCSQKTETPTAENDYQNAITLLQEGKFTDAASAFTALGHYYDASRYAVYSKALASGEDGNFFLAGSSMQALNGFMDSSLLAVYYTGRGYEEEEDYESAYDQYTQILQYSDAGTRAAAIPGKILERDYKAACVLEQNENYQRAISAFTALNGYSDSEAHIASIRQIMEEQKNAKAYADAVSMEAAGKLEEALSAFRALGEYSDSAQHVTAIEGRIQEKRYQEALHFEEQDDLVAAYRIYSELESYQDAATRAAAIETEASYRSAFDMAEEGQYFKAYESYLKLDDYKDSPEKARLLGICTFASEIKPLNSGIFAFKLQDLWGYIDLVHNYDVAPAYESISRFSAAGLAIVSMNDMNSELYSLINRQGKTVSSGMYLDIREGENGFYTAVRNGRRYDYQFVLINQEGEELSAWRTLGDSYNSDPSSKYNRYTIHGPAFTNGVMIATDSNEMYSLLNADGQVIIEKAADIQLIHRSTDNDTVLVKWGKANYQLMALDGTALDENRWSSVSQFMNGYAAVCSKDHLWGFISQDDCHVVIAPQYQEVGYFSEGYAGVKVNNLWGYIDTDNNMVIPPQYTFANAFSDRCAAVYNSSVGWQIIDVTGRLLYFKQNSYLAADEMDQTGQYEQAIAAFESLGNYADSGNRALQSRDKINASVYASAEQLEKDGKYIEAAETFEWLGDYRDAASRAAMARETQNANTYSAAADLEKNGKLEDAIAIYLTLGDYNHSTQHAADLRESINQGICHQAAELEKNAKYEEAISVLNQIPDYTGVKEHIAALNDKIHERDYCSAAALEAEGKYEEAITAFTAMGDYSDSAERIIALQGKILDRDYNAAAALEAEGKFEEAITAFTAMGDYSDSAERIIALQGKILDRDYNAAAALEAEGKFEEAITAFTAMGDYSDSAERITVIHEKILEREYTAAAALEAEGKYEEAITAFTALSDYSDSAERVTVIRGKILEREYTAAAALEAEGKYEEAIAAFLALGDYSDSPVRVKAASEKAAEEERKRAYAAAIEAEERGELETAEAEFAALGDYSDAKARLAETQEKIRAKDYRKAIAAMDKEDYHQAVELLTTLGNYQDSAGLLKQAQVGVQYQTALQDALAGKLAQAYQEFVELGDYKDSAKKAEICGNVSRASRTKQITEGVLIYEFHELWGIANLNTNVITPAKYNSISYHPSSNYSKYGLLYVYVQGGDHYTRWGTEYANMNDAFGYIDQNGKEIIPCVYFGISDFDSNGRCTVGLVDKNQSGYSPYAHILLGIMDHTGHTITEAQWRTLGGSVNKRWDSNYSKNQWEYSFCDLQLPTFIDGRMKVQTPGGTWGYIDDKGKILGTTKWYTIGDFIEGIAVVCEEQQVKVSAYRTSKVKKYGFIDEQGNTIGDVQWDQINDFSNGYAAVQQNGYWGFVNKNNELVIPCQYTEVAEFKKDGTCDVKTKDGTWQVINTSGEVSFF